VFGGISVWPTEILRLVAFALAVVYGGLLLASLRRAYGELERRFDGIGRLWRLPDPFAWRRQSTPDAGEQPESWFQRVFGRPRLEVHAAMALLGALVFFGIGLLAFLTTGFPRAPTRGALAADVDRATILLSVLAMLWLLFLVAGTNLRVAAIVRRLRPGDLRSNEPMPARLAAIGDDAKKQRDFDLVSHLRLLQTIARLGGGSIYGPFVVVLIMILSRWNGFDQWSWPTVLVALVVTSCLVALVSSLLLTAAARAARDETVRLVDRRVSDELGPADGDREKLLARLRHDLVALRDGVFAGVIGHPAVRALLIPTTGIAGRSQLNILG
jgi:hypothetical protein